ncbi:hypothetical protein [Aestuariispira insulae]|nr:hypothetical protein [Aestuariispira insulae]
MKNSKRQLPVSYSTVKIAAITLVAVSISACGVDQPFGLAATATTGFIMEDKLPTDYVAEAITGKDCSYIRRLDDGGPLCRSQDYGQVIEQPIYCYKSLGNVSCYRKPNPYGDGVLPVQ